MEDTPLETPTLNEAEQYYADFEAATQAFAVPGPATFRLRGIVNWAFWSAQPQ